VDTQDQITRKVIAELRSVTGQKTIDLDLPLKDQGIDSITELELIIELERTFNITVPDEKIKQLKTGRAVIDLIQTLLAFHVT
jgi:acyl carrier protein